MGPAEPVPIRPAHSAPGSAALSAGKRAAPAKRVAPATRVASPPGISWSVATKTRRKVIGEQIAGIIGVSHRAQQKQDFKGPDKTINYKAQRGEKVAKKKLEAGRSWFMRFKERSCLRNIKVLGEASADGETAASYSEDLRSLMEVAKQQIVHKMKWSFTGEKMPAKTFLAREETSMSSFKA
ncbi:Tigger transposable element-derived protein 1 [Plecturocebus cupreus]